MQNNNQLTAADKEEFLSFMVELDAEYEQLKLEMQNNLDNEQVLAAIVAACARCCCAFGEARF